MTVSWEEEEEDELELEGDEERRDLDLCDLAVLCVLLLLTDLRDLRDLLDLAEGEGSRREWPSSHSRMEGGISAAGGMVMVSVRCSMIWGGGSAGGSGGASIMYWVRPMAWVRDVGVDVGGWGSSDFRLRRSCPFLC